MRRKKRGAGGGGREEVMGSSRFASSFPIFSPSFLLSFTILLTLLPTLARPEQLNLYMLDFGNSALGGGSESERVSHARVAVDMVNNKTDGFFDDIGADITIAMSVQETGCSNVSNAVAKVAEVFAAGSVTGFVGPLCSLEAEFVVQMLRSSSLPFVSHGATAEFLSNKAIYPNFLRMVPPDSGAAVTIAAFVKRMGWEGVSIINELGSYGQGLSDRFTTEVQKLNITVRLRVEFESMSKSAAGDFSVLDRLVEVYGSGYIFAIFLSPQNIKALADLIINSNQAQREGFVAIYPDSVYLPSIWEGNFTYYNPFLQSSFAIAYSAAVTPAYLDYWKKSTYFSEEVDRTNVDLNGPYSADAVLSFAYSAKSLKAIGKPITAENMLESLRAVSFTGVRGSLNTFDSNNDPAFPMYSISNYQIQKTNPSFVSNWVNIGNYSLSTGVLLVDENNILWRGKTEPNLADKPVSFACHKCINGLCIEVTGVCSCYHGYIGSTCEEKQPFALISDTTTAGLNRCNIVTVYTISLNSSYYHYNVAFSSSNSSVIGQGNLLMKFAEGAKGDPVPLQMYNKTFVGLIPVNFSIIQAVFPETIVVRFSTENLQRIAKPRNIFISIYSKLTDQECQESAKTPTAYSLAYRAISKYSDECSMHQDLGSDRTESFFETFEHAQLSIAFSLIGFLLLVTVLAVAVFISYRAARKYNNPDIYFSRVQIHLNLANVVEMAILVIETIQYISIAVIPSEKWDSFESLFSIKSDLGLGRVNTFEWTAIVIFMAFLIWFAYILILILGLYERIQANPIGHYIMAPCLYYMTLFGTLTVVPVASHVGAAFRCIFVEEFQKLFVDIKGLCDIECYHGMHVFYFMMMVLTGLLFFPIATRTSYLFQELVSTDLEIYYKPVYFIVLTCFKICIGFVSSFAENDGSRDPTAFLVFYCVVLSLMCIYVHYEKPCFVVWFNFLRLLSFLVSLNFVIVTLVVFHSGGGFEWGVVLLSFSAAEIILFILGIKLVFSTPFIKDNELQKLSFALHWEFSNDRQDTLNARESVICHRPGGHVYVDFLGMLNKEDINVSSMGASKWSIVLFIDKCRIEGKFSPAEVWLLVFMIKNKMKILETWYRISKREDSKSSTKTAIANLMSILSVNAIDEDYAPVLFKASLVEEFNVPAEFQNHLIDHFKEFQRQDIVVTESQVQGSNPTIDTFISSEGGQSLSGSDVSNVTSVHSIDRKITRIVPTVNSRKITASRKMSGRKLTQGPQRGSVLSNARRASRVLKSISSRASEDYSCGQVNSLTRFGSVARMSLDSEVDRAFSKIDWEAWDKRSQDSTTRVSQDH
eukprot:Nk52_evm79s226 gene=Nk52_evmTU79s226